MSAPVRAVTRLPLVTWVLCRRRQDGSAGSDEGSGSQRGRESASWRYVLQDNPLARRIKEWQQGRLPFGVSFGGGSPSAAAGAQAGGDGRDGRSAPGPADSVRSLELTRPSIDQVLSLPQAAGRMHRRSGDVLSAALACVQDLSGPLDCCAASCLAGARVCLAADVETILDQRTHALYLQVSASTCR